MEKKLGQRRKRLYSSGKEALFYITVSFTTLRVQHCPCAVKASKPLESEKYMYNCSCICFILTKKLLQIRSEEAIFKKKLMKRRTELCRPPKCFQATVVGCMWRCTRKCHMWHRRFLIAGLQDWLLGHSGPGSGPEEAHQSTGEKEEEFRMIVQ